MNEAMSAIVTLQLLMGVLIAVVTYIAKRIKKHDEDGRGKGKK